MAAAIVQASGQWLSERLSRLIAEGNRRRDEIRITNGIIVAADKLAQRDRDPVRRKATRAGLHRLAQRQGRIAKVFRTFWGTANGIATKARAWLKDNSIAAPQLGSLGLLQVPAGLVVTLVAGASIWGVNEWIKNANGPQRERAIAFRDATEAFVDGRIALDQYQVVIAAAEKAALDKSPKSDPVGLAHALEAATPIIGLGALVLLAKWMLAARSAGRTPQRRAA